MPTAAAGAAPTRSSAITAPPAAAPNAAPSGAGIGGDSGRGLNLQLAPGTGAGRSGSLAYPYQLNQVPRQKSLSEMANAQLNPGGPRDKLAESVDAATKPNCLDDGTLGLLNAVVAPVQALRGKCK